MVKGRSVFLLEIEIKVRNTFLIVSDFFGNGIAYLSAVASLPFSQVQISNDSP